MKITLKKRNHLLMSYIYIYIPIVIFFVGWTKPIVSIISVFVFSFVTYRIFKKINSNEKIEINFCFLMFFIIFLCIIGYYVGFGRWVDQAGDWIKHNAILYDLTNKPWPVYYINGNEHSMLVYYIAQYLFPSLIGKIFCSCRVSEIILYFWNVVGLILVYVNILFYVKAKTKMQFICLIILVFFSVPLILSQLSLKMMTKYDFIGNTCWYIFTDTIRLQYTSNFEMLRYVFPQCIPVWLALISFLQNKKYVEFYVPLLLPIVLFATLTFPGLVLFAIASIIEMLINGKSLKDILLKMFSIENIISIIVFGTIFIIYLYGNVFSKKPGNIGFELIPYNKDPKGWIVYIIFVLINVLTYAAILWKSNKTNVLYYTTILSLLIFPLFKMGLYNDFTMRTSIPSLFVLMILIIKYFNDNLFIEKNKSICAFATFLLIMIGAIYPSLQLIASIKLEKFSEIGNILKLDTLEVYANRGANVDVDLKYNYYAYDIENNLFYKYLARKNMESKK